MKTRHVTARILAIVIVLLLPCAVHGQSETTQIETQMREAVSQAERAWLDAYETDDVEAMDSIIAEGFTITFTNGRVDTKADVIAMLKPGTYDSATDTVQWHYTEDRTIRIIGTTAILTGIYVNPHADGTISRNRYTDTWMLLDDRWRVVASHLSKYADLEEINTD